jgi:hypothetical protein
MSSTIYVGGGYRETMVGRSYEPTISRLINGQRITLYRVNDDHKYMSSYDTTMMLEKITWEIIDANPNKPWDSKIRNEYRAKHMRELERKKVRYVKEQALWRIKQLGILKQQKEHQDMVRRVDCLILECSV